eukprot:g12770.t1
MDVANGEEFDEAFLLELDAVESAAVQHSLAPPLPAGAGGERGLAILQKAEGPVEQHAQQRAAAQALRGSVMLDQGGSTGEDSNPGDSPPEAANTGCFYVWAVENIFVQDDAAAIDGSAEDRVGQGELAVNCRQGPSGALEVVNVLVTAAGGVGSTMDIPRHAIARFRLDERSSSPSEPSPAACEKPPFTLLLGLGIGCSIVMSGLVLKEEHRRPPLPIAGDHSSKSSTDRFIDGTNSTIATVSRQDAAAAVCAGCTPKPPKLQPVALLALPIATPERRRLASTEFVTPLSPAPIALTPQGDGDEDGDNGNPLLAVGAPDPVLMKLIRDFDHGGVRNGPSGLSSFSSSRPCSETLPACSSGSDIIGAEDVEVPPAVSATVRGHDGSSGVVGFVEQQPATADPVGTAESATNKRQADGVSQRVSMNVRHLASVWGSGAAGRGEEVTGERYEVFRGCDGHGGSSKINGGRSSGGGCSDKSQRMTLTENDQEVDVPDGEWRRPLVVSPPNRRSAAAGRRRPKVRDGSRNGSRGSVVLRLDNDNDDEGGERVSSRRNSGDTASAGVKKLDTVSADRRIRSAHGGVDGGGGGVGGQDWEHKGRTEDRSRKRPLDGGGSRKTGKTAPPPPPPLPSSWPARRRALHERYRDSEEHKAAEQTEAEGAERRRCRRGGSGPSRGQSGWGGELMCPGLRVFRRQEQAFTYADALAARLTPADAARYKVLSFETSATGSRKFLVCDIRRFEEHYPYTALPHRSLLRHLLRPKPFPPLPSPSSPSLPLPQQEQSCSGSVDVGAEKGIGSCKASDEGEFQTKGTNLCPSATITVRSLPSGGANSQEQQQQQQQEEQQQRQRQRRRQRQQEQQRAGLSVREEGSAARASATVPLGHVYEIIREGCPCRMYYDLEFSRSYNDGLDGEELVRTWINVVSGKLHQVFGISVGGANFLDLDSSTPKKFSRHLILHLPGDQLFQDNSHVGRFVNSLAEDLESWRPPQPLPQPQADPGSDPSSSTVFPTGATSPAETSLKEATVDGSDRPGRSYTIDDGDGGGNGNISGGGALERLWVKDGDGRSVLCADVSVYTRNRCFRLLGSSKFGKSTALRIAATNQRPLEHMIWRGKGGVLSRAASPQPRDVARTLLHDSLVVPAALRPTGERFLTVGGGAGQHRYSRFGRSQTHPASLRGQHHQHGFEHFGESSDKGGRPCSCCGLEGHGTGGSCSRQGSLEGQCRSDNGGWRVTSQGFGVSPFPAIDSFLRTLICQGGTKGDLRQWNYTAGEVSPLPQQRDVGEGGARAGLTAPRNESAPPVAVVRKLTHQVANNRWCWNIGRAHKSNHVFLVTDLLKGEVRQHCHDRECRRSGYRSNPVKLPSGATPSKDDLEAFELELGLAAAMRESPADWAAVA